MIRAVIFDMGGVVNLWEPDRVAPGLAGQPDFLAFVTALDAGTPAAEAVANAPEARRAAFALYAERIDEAHAGAVPGTADVIEALAARGTILIAMTNAAEAAWDALARVHPVTARFDDVFVSAREGLSKPDPAAYRRILERNDLAPAEALMVDDKAANVAAAEALGMAGHVFADAGALRADLAERGLL